MKTLTRLLFFLSLLSALRAQSNSLGGYTAVPISVPGDRYDLGFRITWTCDDFPINSAPGLIELYDANGQKVGEVAAGIYQGDGPTVIVDGPGSVSDVTYWAAVYCSGGPVADGSLAATWHITGLAPGNYTLRMWRYTTWDGRYRATTVWTTSHWESGTIPGPTNSSPTVTLLSPGDQTVTAGTTLILTSHATDPDGNITGHNLDIQRPAGDWNFEGGFATGEPYQGGPVGSASDSTRSANFTFSDIGTYTVRSAADDGSGWVHSTTVTINVVAPPTTQFALVTSAGAGGSISPGGSYDAGTVVSVTATPDATHDFAGWSGDAAGAANPIALVVDRNLSVQALFTAKLYPLTTSASVGGFVTPGGNYPYGTAITITAAPDATHRFVGWAGDASGSNPSILLAITSPLNVQALFVNKTAQSVIFPSPGNQPVGGAAFTLAGSSSSGLPVSFIVLTGPATLNGTQLQVTGPGPITVQASQPGDAFYLPATNVTQTFNAVATALLKYCPGGRTLLQAGAANGTAPFVLEKP